MSVSCETRTNSTYGRVCMCKCLSQKHRCRCTIFLSAPTMRLLGSAECLTSSWIRRASLLFGFDILAGSPKQYTVKPPSFLSALRLDVVLAGAQSIPMGGKKTLISPRVIN